jgi:hypothetical protein
MHMAHPAAAPLPPFPPVRPSPKLTLALSGVVAAASVVALAAVRSTAGEAVGGIALVGALMILAHAAMRLAETGEEGVAERRLRGRTRRRREPDAPDRRVGAR